MADYTQLYSGLGWGTTFEMNAKKPLIAKRSFPTLDDAYGYVNDLTATGTACQGLIIAVTADANDKNNGIYWIKSVGVAGADGELIPGELIKAGSGTGSMAIATLTVNEAGKVTEATTDNIGQIIYVTSGTDVYPAGPYIVTGDGTVAKLGTTTATGDIAGDVETLKGKVGTLENEVADIKDDYVLKVTGQRLMTDAEGTKLAGIADDAQVNIIESVKVDGSALTIAADKSVDIILPVTGIATGDKVLSLDGKNIKSTLSFTRENIGDVDSLVVKGINDTVIGSVPVADFIADGMLESVTPKADNPNIFVFTFNSAAGSKSFEVDFSKYVDTYNADDITLELGANNTFKVKDGVFDAAGAAATVKSEITETLKDYVTSSSLTTTLGDYAKTTDVNTTLADYVKGTELDTKVSGLGYVKGTELETTLGDYTKTEDLATVLSLSDYAKTTDVNATLSDYAKTADVTETLKDYVTTGSLSTTLGDYVKGTELDTKVSGLGYVKEAALNSYVSKIELDTEVANLNYVKSSVLNDYVLSTTLEDYVKSSVITTSSSVALTTEGALEVNTISTDDLKNLGILSE